MPLQKNDAGAPVDLLDAFKDVAAALPEDKRTAPGFIELSERTLPVPPPLLTTAGLCATWTYIFYDQSPVEHVSLEGDKPTFRALGLLILAGIFHRPHARSAVRLAHPRSSLRRLVVGRYWDESPDAPGLATQPSRFNYYPNVVERHPWRDRWLQPPDLPVLFLTNEDDCVTSAADLPARDVGVGFGSFEASARFAELLLNFSLAPNERREVKLEGEQGSRGVGPGSVEMTLWLPGGLGHLDSEPL